MEERPALTLSIFWSSTLPNVFFLNVIQKWTISLFPDMIKGLNTSFTLVSAGYEICQDRQRRPLFDEKIVM